MYRMYIELTSRINDRLKKIKDIDLELEYLVSACGPMKVKSQTFEGRSDSKRPRLTLDEYYNKIASLSVERNRHLVRLEEDKDILNNLVIKIRNLSEKQVLEYIVFYEHFICKLDLKNISKNKGISYSSLKKANRIVNKKLAELKKENL